MEQLLLDKEELLDILRLNRDKHREVFTEALASYKKVLLADAEAKVKALQRGKIPDLQIRFTRPEDHTRDYDRVIRMVQMHQDEYYGMTEQDFAQYVEDDWHWKRQWAVTASSYAAGKFSEVYGVTEDGG
jgi:hypothetical protein